MIILIPAILLQMLYILKKQVSLKLLDQTWQQQVLAKKCNQQVNIARALAELKNVQIGQLRPVHKVVL